MGQPPVTRREWEQALAIIVIAIIVVAFVFGIVFAVFGTLRVYRDMFPSHPGTVCVLAHDEYHDSDPVSICDKRVPR